MEFNYYGNVGLRDLGISNTMLTMQDLVSERKPLRAYCTSHACAGYLSRVVVNVSKHVDVCPKCKNSLLWRRG